MYIIYKYTNSANGKVYIGQTCKSLEERAQYNGRNYRECRRFYNAIQKYSWDAFNPEVLEVVDTQEDANERERYYISQYNSTDERFGYNILCGGDQRTMSKETKEILSAKAKSRYIDKTSNPMYGKKHSVTTIKLQKEKKSGVFNPMYGSKWTETQRAKSGTKGIKLNLSDLQREVLRKNCQQLGRTVGLKPVRCIDDGVVFKSVSDAAEYSGVSKSTMCGHLSGRQKTCAGKRFEYVN